MRELIRPTLFMIVRLGLFLTVVAWSFGQWWTLSFAIPVNDHTALAGFGRTSIYFGVHSRRQPGLVMIQDYEGSTVGSRWLSDRWTEELPGEFAKYNSDLRAVLLSMIPRFKLDRQRDEFVRTLGYVFWIGPQKGLRINHRLVVTLFTIFNGLLMWRNCKHVEVR